MGHDIDLQGIVGSIAHDLLEVQYCAFNRASKYFYEVFAAEHCNCGVSGIGNVVLERSDFQLCVMRYWKLYFNQSQGEEVDDEECEEEYLAKSMEWWLQSGLSGPGNCSDEEVFADAGKVHQALSEIHSFFIANKPHLDAGALVALEQIFSKHGTHEVKDFLRIIRAFAA